MADGLGWLHRHEKAGARLYCVPLFIKVYSGQPRKARGEYICVSPCSSDQRQSKKRRLPEEPSCGGGSGEGQVELVADAAPDLGWVDLLVRVQRFGLFQQDLGRF